MINNTGSINISEQRQIAVDGNFIERAIKLITQPVFDFLQPSTEKDADYSNIDIEAEIKKAEYNSAIMEKTLLDADPNSRSKFNIVF